MAVRTILSLLKCVRTFILYSTCNIITSRVSSQSNRIDPLCLSMCPSVTQHSHSKTFWCTVTWKCHDIVMSWTSVRQSAQAEGEGMFGEGMCLVASMRVFVSVGQSSRSNSDNLFFVMTFQTESRSRAIASELSRKCLITIFLSLYISNLHVVNIVQYGIFACSNSVYWRWKAYLPQALSS